MIGCVILKFLYLDNNTLGLLLTDPCLNYWGLVAAKIAVCKDGYTNLLKFEGKSSLAIVKWHAGCISSHVNCSTDVTKLESIQAALKEVEKCVGEDGLTLLVNNAGTRLFNDLETENAKNMMTIYSTNTIGPLQMSQVCLRLRFRNHPYRQTNLIY